MAAALLAGCGFQFLPSGVLDALYLHFTDLEQRRKQDYCDEDHGRQKDLQLPEEPLSAPALL